MDFIKEGNINSGEEVMSKLDLETQVKVLKKGTEIDIKDLKERFESLENTIIVQYGVICVMFLVLVFA